MTVAVQGVTLGDLPDRRRLRASMTRCDPQAFLMSTGENNEALQHAYEEMFHSLLQDAVVIPGFGTAQEMLLERVAWLWAAQKLYDQDPEGASALRYEKLTDKFLSAMRTLFAARQTADANESFKRAFAQQVFAAVSTAVQTTVGVHDEAQADRVMREVLIQLQAVLASNQARVGT